MDRFGVAIWNFPGESLVKKAAPFPSMGFDSISVLGNFLDADAVQIGEFTQLLETHDLPLTVHGGFARQGDAFDEQATLAQVEGILDWHSRTGRLKCLTFDIPWKEVSPHVYRTDPDPVADIFERVLEITAGKGIRVAMEDCPLDEEHLDRLDVWRERFPHLGILVDLGHMNMRLREPRDNPRALRPGDIAAAIRAIPLEIIELHVHGNQGTKDEHAPPYTGSMDFDEVAGVLREVGFSGVSTIEIVPGWCGLSEEEGLTAARRSLEFWKERLNPGS